jgi:hypothetical protein
VSSCTKTLPVIHFSHSLTANTALAPVLVPLWLAQHNPSLPLLPKSLVDAVWASGCDTKHLGIAATLNVEHTCGWVSDPLPVLRDKSILSFSVLEKS